MYMYMRKNNKPVHSENSTSGQIFFKEGLIWLVSGNSFSIFVQTWHIPLYSIQNDNTFWKFKCTPLLWERGGGAPDTRPPWLQACIHGIMQLTHFCCCMDENYKVVLEQNPVVHPTNLMACLYFFLSDSSISLDTSCSKNPMSRFINNISIWMYFNTKICVFTHSIKITQIKVFLETRNVLMQWLLSLSPIIRQL